MDITTLLSPTDLTMLLLTPDRFPRNYFSEDWCGSFGECLERIQRFSLCLSVLPSLLPSLPSLISSLLVDGQTGSGKSYSMMGSDSSPGIIPRICRALFYLIRRFNQEHGIHLEEASPEDRPFTVEASYLEIYNEVITPPCPSLWSLSILPPSFRKFAIFWIPTDTIFVFVSTPRLVSSWRT
jgi:hypothetical protein